ncbi:hypothetical protein BKA66DRAFT_289435 [Pyrenochaeta sp. MPI-SDFR-AT-0127]|nr:hypothetical protein BKA66DRAFT_289435 [Pyrenochaeta sp. MPI-SDFR-AT-0127]
MALQRRIVSILKGCRMSGTRYQSAIVELIAPPKLSSGPEKRCLRGAFGPARASIHTVEVCHAATQTVLLNNSRDPPIFWNGRVLSSLEQSIVPKIILNLWIRLFLTAHAISPSPVPSLRQATEMRQLRSWNCAAIYLVMACSKPAGIRMFRVNQEGRWLRRQVTSRVGEDKSETLMAAREISAALVMTASGLRIGPNDEAPVLKCTDTTAS